MKAGTWRKEKVAGDKAMAWGHDHAIGTFITIWQLADPNMSTDWPANQPDHSNIIVDMDEFTHDSFSLRDAQLVAIAREHGFELTRGDLG